MQSYKTWIASRLDVRGPLGDLARVIHADSTFPADSTSEKEISQWLVQHGMFDKYKISFLGTWKFYLADATKKPKEASLEQKLVFEVEKRGGLCWKFVSPGTVGVPDRIVVAPGGKVAFVEMKSPSGKLQPIQRKRANELLERGAEWYLLKSNQDVYLFCRRYLVMKYNPHQYQEYATARILDTPYIGLFLEMGLGKTVSSLTAIDKLLNDYFEAERVLVIAPLRVADDTWAREIHKWDHLNHLKISKVLGTVDQRRKALKASADIYVINRENVEWLVGEYGSKWPFDTVVIDEVSSFKNHQSKRFKALRRVRPFIRRLVGLTGTPAPNSLMDLWAPVYLLDQGERLGKTIGAYRDRYFTPGASNGHVVYDWRQKKESEERIYEAISDIAVSMKAEDWLKLPERIDRTVNVRLTSKAAELYKKLEKELLIEYADADVVAQTAAVLSNKLLQMASGAVYDEERGVKLIHDAKLDALEDIIEAAQGKPVMVFYNYQHSLARIQQRFPQARILRKGKDGNEDIRAWNNDEIELLLLHPKSAGHGLNLQESSCRTVVWFDQIWSLEEDQQANARVYRQGVRHNIVILRLVAEGTMDAEAVEALERKASGQEALMQAVKARIERVRAS